MTDMSLIQINITENNLSYGLWWEQDTSCWEAIKCNPIIFGYTWCWQPMNEKAFDKSRPEREMVNYYPLKIKE